MSNKGDAIRLTLLLGSCWFYCISAGINALAATAPTLRFNHQVVEHGADVRRLGGINRIIQDHYGFMWFAGSGGLARYDGTQLKLYQHKTNDPTSLPDNYIWDLAINSQGHLWLATGRGICRYIVEKDHFNCPKTLAGNKVIASAASALLFDQNDRLYVGTHGLPYRIDFAKNTLEEFSLSADGSTNRFDNTVWDIEIGPNGNLWFATRNTGIIRFSPLTKNIEIINTPCKSKEEKTIFYSLAFDHDNNLWAGTSGGGLCWYNPSSNIVEKIVWPTTLLGSSDNAVINDIHVDIYGNILASIDHQGLFIFDDKKKLLKRQTHSGGQTATISSNQTRSIFEDQNKDIWIGIFPFGVDFVDRSRAHITTYNNNAVDPTSLSHNAILSVFEDSQKQMWVGTEHGLNRLKNDGTFQRYLADPSNPQALQANAILSITEDQQGYLWVGTWSGGLHRFDPATEQFKNYNSQGNGPNQLGDSFSWGAFVDSKNRLWVGSEGYGLQRYRRETDDFIRYDEITGDNKGISNLYVLNMAEDDDGYLWLSTYYGLNRFDPETETFTVWLGNKDDPTALSSSIIKSLVIANDGHLWVGTHDGGLNRFNPKTGHVKRLGLNDGLPSLTVSSLLEDNAGNIWAATSNGLARINTETFKIDVYTETSGLAGINYNRNGILAARDGTLYFGSTEGLTVMAPNALVKKESWHPIHLTEFRVLSQVADIGPDSVLKESTITSNQIILDYSVGMFSFDFAVLSYRFPDKYEYAYQLEGFDQEWRYIGYRNTATYTNLNPGDYRFKVKARVPGEQWQTSERNLTLTITPPWWRTYWAYAIYSIIFSAFVYFIYCIGRLKRTSDNYRYLAATDALTGIYNRSGILSLIDSLNNDKDNHHNRVLATLIIDIDHFKKINDNYGHAVGDQAIRHVVNTLKNNIRKDDHLGRWGGEEFIILLLIESEAELEKCGSDLCRAIAESPVQLDDTPLKITISIGGVLHRRDESFEDACQRADDALYKAKETGRNRFCGHQD